MPHGGRRFFEDCKHHKYLFGEFMYVWQHKCRRNDSESVACTRKAKHAPYALTDGEWSMLHWAALLTGTLWQVSRSEQSDECHL